MNEQQEARSSKPIYNTSDLSDALRENFIELSNLNQEIAGIKNAIAEIKTELNSLQQKLRAEQEKVLATLSNQGVIGIISSELNKLIAIREELEFENKKLTEKLELVVPRKKRGFFR